MFSEYNKSLPKSVTDLLMTYLVSNNQSLTNNHNLQLPSDGAIVDTHYQETSITDEEIDSANHNIIVEQINDIDYRILVGASQKGSDILIDTLGFTYQK